MERSANMKPYVVTVFFLLTLTLAQATPPGIANHPSHATCKIKKYKHCYNLEHVCPKFCPNGCTVHCASCKPICVDGSTPNPDPEVPEPEPEPEHKPKPKPKPEPEPSYTPPSSPPTPSSPTPPTPSTPTPLPPTLPTPTTPYPPASTPPSPTPPSTPTPSAPTPSTPNPPTTPSTPATPSPTPSPPNPPSTTPPTPSTPNPPSTTPSTPTPPTDSEAAPKRAKCQNKGFPQCYGTEYVCPKACPGGCEVNCVTCKPVCKCDRPGSVCQDPRFIGGDGLTFYFHGKKDGTFCLLSDPNLHINAHFIGKRNPKMTRDFTWVQSIAVLFNTHQLYLGALKTAAWDDSVDRLSVMFDGQPIYLPQVDGTTWTSSPEVSPSVIIRRVSSDANNVEIQVESLFKITARVVPITAEDSRIHGYNVTDDDCLAHLDMGFKFYGLSNSVHGVLGQTYRPDYVSRVKIGASMPVMGGDREFETTDLFTADCAAARFTGAATDGAALELPELSCASGIDGKGVICKR